MPFDLDVGLLVPLATRPTADFVAALIELTESEDSIQEFARATHDPRMTREHWTTILRAELLQLLAWTLRRLTASLEPAATTREANPINSVLSLLPRYGVALHVLRRAAAFSGLGIPTACGFPDRAQESMNVVKEIGERLAVSQTLSVLNCDCSDAGRQLDVKNTTVVVTGRAESVRNVAHSFAWQQVLGCTGRCCVVVGDDPDAVRHLARVLEGTQLEQSCARVGAVLLACGGLTADAVIRCHCGNDWQLPGKFLAEHLNELHPSVVMTPRKSVSHSLTSQICGYRLYYCNLEGMPDRRDGFGADPVYGWPGDYLL